MCSRKNVLIPPLSSAHNEPRRSACSGRKSCGISRNVRGPSAGAVGSAQTPIWPYSSLRLLPAPTVAPKALSLRLVAGIEAGAPGRSEFPPPPCSLSSGGPAWVWAASTYRLRSGVCSPPRAERGRVVAPWGSLAHPDWGEKGVRQPHRGLWSVPAVAEACKGLPPSEV